MNRRAPHYQNGQVEIRSDGKGEYYSGRYSLYVKNEQGKEVRTQPRPFLGYCSEISESEAFDRLQKLIRESQIKGPKGMDEANLQFWQQQLSQMKALDQITEDRSEDVALNELEQLEDLLTEAAERSNIDWHIHAQVAHECCWSVEVRITAVPNATGPDHSDVFLSCGHDSPEECAVDLLPTIKRYLSRLLPAGNDNQ